MMMIVQRDQCGEGVVKMKSVCVLIVFRLLAKIKHVHISLCKFADNNVRGFDHT